MQAFDEAVCEGRIDLGEVVAQHLYLHVDDANNDAAREWSGDATSDASDGGAAAEVVFDWGDGASDE